MLYLVDGCSSDRNSSVPLDIVEPPLLVVNKLIPDGM